MNSPTVSWNGVEPAGPLTLRDISLQSFTESEGLMTVAELLEGVQFITDADGNKKAVVVDLVVWEGMLARLEDLERLADEVDERSWDEAFAKFPDALARLAGEARGERQAGRTRELDPDTL